MKKKKILFISGSIGLGHVTRDLVIARELRKQNPNIEIFWLATDPASMLIRNAGEQLLPESFVWANQNIIAENLAKDARFNLVMTTLKVRDEWAHNVAVFREVTKKDDYDLVIGDETYEISTALKKKPELKNALFVLIYDFIGVDAMTNNLVEKFGAYYWNRFWGNDYKKESLFVDLRLMVGEEEDVPDKKFGFLLPNRRDWAKEKCKFIGYIVPFNPVEYGDKTQIRKGLGYGSNPLVVCSIGGTAIGKWLLGLCGQAFPIIREKIPDLQMVLVAGPRLSPESLTVPKEVEVKGYVPDLYQHFAASDLAIIQAGGTTTIELTALKRPFLYFPLEEHCEQQLYVAGRLARHQAGKKMSYSETTPQSLAEAIIAHIGKEVNYADIPTDGAQKAAQLINQLLIK